MKKLERFILVLIPVLLLAPLAFFGVRWMLAHLAIEREWRSGPTQAFDLEPTFSLEIIPLYEEASVNDEFVSGHGVSYLIRTDSATILMDVGDNPDQGMVPPFVQNMRALGISPQEIDVILISHPHPDHVGGVPAWKRENRFLGRGIRRVCEHALMFVPPQITYPGAVTSKVPIQLSPDVATIGVISYPEVFPLSLFEPKGTEQALVVNVAGEGLVLITGCGHPTIERLVIRAESLYDRPMVGIVGGLHYEGAGPDDVQPHIQFLMSRQPSLVALSPHDSSPEALAAFRGSLPGQLSHAPGG